MEAWSAESQTKGPSTESPGFRLGATASHQSLPVLSCSSILHRTSHFQKKRASSDLPPTLLHTSPKNQRQQREISPGNNNNDKQRTQYTYARTQPRKTAESVTLRSVGDNSDNLNNIMPLTKKPTPKQLERYKQRMLRKGANDQDQGAHGFSQARLDRICNSMQPLMTKHASDEEMERIFRDVDGFVAGGGGKSEKGEGGYGLGLLQVWLGRCFGCFRTTSE